MNILCHNYNYNFYFTYERNYVPCFYYGSILESGERGRKNEKLYFFIFSNFEIDFYYIIYKFFFISNYTNMYVSLNFFSWCLREIKLWYYLFFVQYFNYRQNLKLLLIFRVYLRRVWFSLIFKLLVFHKVYMHLFHFLVFLHCILYFFNRQSKFSLIKHSSTILIHSSSKIR